MHPFKFYLKLGFEHISNLSGYDHILFLIVLCAIYRIEQWRNVLYLVTAFTIGHSVTLVLVSLEVLTIPSQIIKFLIPTTILLTAVHNIWLAKPVNKEFKMQRNYLMALFFGFIHGMDFSNYFKALIMDPSDIIIPLLGFNLGIELGQILVVFAAIAVAYFFLNYLKVQHREWNLFISGVAVGMSLISMAENKFW